jgi:hypothetical protein
MLEKAKLLTLPILLCCGMAGAYLLPSGAIVRRLGEARDEHGATSLRVEGSVSLFGELASGAQAALKLSGERAELQLDGIFSLKAPGRCRLELTAPGGNRLAAVQSGGRRRGEGEVPGGLLVAVEQLCSLLATRGGEGGSRAAFERHLSALRVQPRSVVLGRVSKEVTYILGDPSPGQPQLWIYKDTFFPARLTFGDSQGTSWDVRLSDYGSSVTGSWAPRVVELHKAGTLVLRFTALKADSPVALADRLF